MANSYLSSVLAPAQKRSMSDHLALRLRAAILEGHFAPGERLRENDLATAFEVSRGPIREALVKLEREGLVIIRPHRGAFVAQLSLEDLEEVFTLRLAIEKLAVSRCIERNDRELASNLDRAIAQMEGAVDKDLSVVDGADVDLQFHDQIYAGSKHTRVQEVWSMIRPQIHVLLLNRNILDKGYYRETLLESHKSIADAIREGDQALSAKLIEEHLEGSFELVKRSLVEREKGVAAE
jgi:DNA-binding GntR family transcriptional regulator